MEILVLHSVFGLRAVERAAADRLRAAGHRVVVADLYAGATATGGTDAGFALMEAVGWPRIVGRARKAAAGLADEAVLVGFSMGVGVVAELWPERLDAAAVVCLHAPTDVPPGVRAAVPVQLHVGAADEEFSPVDRIGTFRASAAAAGAQASVYRYPGVGHFFTDPASPEYDAAAAGGTWTRVLRLLESVG